MCCSFYEKFLKIVSLHQKYSYLILNNLKTYGSSSVEFLFHRGRLQLKPPSILAWSPELKIKIWMSSNPLLYLWSSLCNYVMVWYTPLFGEVDYVSFASIVIIIRVAALWLLLGLQPQWVVNWFCSCFHIW